MAYNVKFLQTQTQYLAGAGVSVGDGTMTLRSFLNLDGTPVTMSNFGTKGYGTVEPNTRGREEPITFTGITQNLNGTATLTGVSTQLPFYPYTETANFAKSHPGGVKFIITNTAGLYDTNANKNDQGTILQTWTFNALANNANPKIDSNSYTFTSLDYITKGFSDTTYLRVDGTNQMTANLNFGNFKGINLADPTNPKDAVNLETLQAAVISGGTPATTSAGGYVKVATQAEFDNTTDTTVVGPFTFYNMATISQIKTAGVQEPFTYGENIAQNDYVFQATGSEAIQVAQTNASNQNTTFIASANAFISQTFTSTSKVSTVRSIVLDLAVDNTSGISGNMTAQIFAVSAGLPTGSALGTSNNVSVATLTTGFVETLFTFGTPVAITGGADYAIVLNVSGITFGGRHIEFGYSTSGSPSYATSTNAGSTWTTAGLFPLFYRVNQGITAGRVYRTDIVTPIYDMGPYKGFAQVTAAAGTSNNVQIGALAQGFTSLTPAGNIYLDPAVVGGITQTAGITAGRAIGVAISATKIQLANMRKRSAAQTYAGAILNQDGNLVYVISVAAAGSFIINESNTVSTSQIAAGQNGNSSTDNVTVTIPVRAGYLYTAVYSGGSATVSANFYPMING